MNQEIILESQLRSCPSDERSEYKIQQLLSSQFASTLYIKYTWVGNNYDNVHNLLFRNALTSI